MSTDNDQTPPLATPDRADEPPLTDLPSPVTVTDRLLTIYRSPGPYTSVYLTNGDTVNGRFDRRVAALQDTLRESGATDQVIAAIDARLALPTPDDTAGIAIIVADDGTTIVDHGLEPPHNDFGVVDTLPHVGPLFVWEQARVSHLVVTFDERGADVAMFGLDHFARVEHLDTDQAAIVDRVGSVAETLLAELIVLVGDPSITGPAGDELITRVASSCRIVAEPTPDDVDRLVDVVVRHVSDVAARRTVQLLREHRFLDGHDAAADGRNETISRLADGTATRLLINDDPLDQERIWIGERPSEISIAARPGYHQARLTDALIRSAVLQGIPVHIVPSTGPDGPDQDVGALIDHRPQFDT